MLKKYTNVNIYYIMNVDKIVWNMIDTYFKDNPNYLVKHQTDSYDLFLKEGISQIFREKNPIKIMKGQDPTTMEFANVCELYLGGKKGDRIYYGKPIIYDDDGNKHFMFPNEARLRNMTYGFTIHYDVEVDFTIQNEEFIVSHNALSRDIFGEGIKLALSLKDKNPGIYSMSDLLKG